jgi:hypothetical protein
VKPTLHILETGYFKCVPEVIHCVLSLTDQNFIHAELNKRLNSGNSCSNSLKNSLSSVVLYKNTGIKIHKV